MIPLVPCAQKVSQDGRFRYLGGWTPLPEPFRSRATRLAKRVANCLPATQGYLGVDMVLGHQESDADVAIEVNPRLTSSYLGLRRLVQGNLAEAMLRVAEGREVELRFSNERIEFGAG